MLIHHHLIWWCDKYCICVLEMNVQDDQQNFINDFIGGLTLKHKIWNCVMTFSLFTFSNFNCFAFNFIWKIWFQLGFAVLLSQNLSIPRFHGWKTFSIRLETQYEPSHLKKISLLSYRNVRCFITDSYNPWKWQKKS